MEYQIENNRLFKYNENIIAITDFKSDVDFTTDETGYKLIEALKPTKFEQVGKDIKITNDAGKSATIKTVESKRPTFDYNDMVCEFEINVKHLRIAKEFVDKKALKPVLSGVYINSKSTIIATDVIKMFAIDKGDSDQYIVVPTDFIEELEVSETAKIKFNKFIACVSTEHKIVYGRLVMGNYPNVSKLIRDINWNGQPANFEKFNEELKVGRLVGQNVLVEFDGDKATFKDANIYEGTNTIQLNGSFMLSTLESVAKYLKNPSVASEGNRMPARFKENGIIYVICQTVM